MKYILKISLAMLIIFCSIQLFAQTKATTEHGKNIIIYEDGTWAYEVNDIDCNKLVKNITTSKTNGVMSVNPIKLAGNNNSMQIDLIKNESITVINMKVDGKNICFGPKDFVTFTTVDGTEIKLNFTSSVANCKGEFSLFFGEPFKNIQSLEKLINSQLKSIVIKSYHYDLKEYESNLFLRTINCLN